MAGKPVVRAWLRWKTTQALKMVFPEQIVREMLIIKYRVKS